MTKLLNSVAPAAKAVVAAVLGAALPFLSIGLSNGFDWKAFVSAVGGAAISALLVFLVPNAPAPSGVKAVSGGPTS